MIEKYVKKNIKIRIHLIHQLCAYNTVNLYRFVKEKRLIREK